LDPYQNHSKNIQAMYRMYDIKELHKTAYWAMRTNFGKSNVKV